MKFIELPESVQVIAAQCLAKVVSETDLDNKERMEAVSEKSDTIRDAFMKLYSD